MPSAPRETVSACEQAVSDSLSEPVAEAKDYVEAAPVKHADETGWREGRKRAWLWSAATNAVTVFLVHASRGGKATRELLGSFAGILVSDRWNGYNGWKTRRRQLCWAHLIRDFTAFAEASGRAGRIGEELLDQAKRMFQWHLQSWLPGPVPYGLSWTAPERRRGTRRRGGLLA